MNPILSISDPRILRYRNLKKPPSNQNYFIAENEKVVQRLLASPLRVHSIYGIEEAILRNKDWIDQSGIDPERIYFSDRDLLESVTGFSINRGIMAEAEIPNALTVNDILSNQKSPSSIIIMNRIYDSENIGSMIRTARAFGIQDMIYDKQCSPPYLRRSVRVSMGTIFGMNIGYSSNLSEDLKCLKEEGYSIIGATANSDLYSVSSLYQISFPKKWVIIFGNEGDGIHPSILSDCNLRVHIPMNPEVDSLNVSHSLASILAVWQSQQDQQII